MHIMANTTKLHTVDSLIDESGNRQIFYNQNTIKDVKVDDDQDETIEGHLNYYAECSTAADDASKAIGVIGGEHDVVKAGATFDITFTNGNTAADPTLVVNNGTAYPLDGITETTIKAGQTFSFIFNGEKFISKGSSSSGTEIKKDTVTGDTEEGSDKYVALVDGAESNATIKFDENIVVNKEGLKAPIANSTVKFEDATAEANTDYRTSSPLTSEESVATGFQKLKKILAGLGALAFKPSVGTTELDTTLSAAYNNRVSKSDLYNGTDYATAGEKALDAKAGATLQNSITSLNSKMTSFENTKSSITGSALGKALSMTSSTSWNDVITKIKGVSNQGAKTSSL
ncbi:MAG TPA: hypothetical protein DCW90_17465, partial [Lachnospiraceae bacterium]|nr:hypothetical protein [Lachnospiraceae bacterium]